MTDMIYRMGRLMQHAAHTRQTPTEWVLGTDALATLRIICRQHDSVLESVGPDSFTLFGVPVRQDVRLPRLRVVLKAGKNTVGAFTEGYDD